MRIRQFIVFLACVVCAPEVARGNQPAGATETIVVHWNRVLLDAVRQSGLGPPMVARAIAIVHTCAYDAWSAYDATAVGTRLGSSLRRPPQERTRENEETAISHAAYRALVDLFPARQSALEAEMLALGLDPTDPSTDPTTPVGIGNTACAAVLEFRHGDGSNQLGEINGGAPYSDYTDYVPVNSVDTIVDPNHWQPLRYSNGLTPPYLAPHWGLVVPFALNSGGVLRPVPPAFFPSHEYFRQASDIQRISATLNDRQKVIAEYWADGPRSETPPGHWNLFAQFVSDRDRHRLADDVKLFFALGNALLDASIAAWDCKRYYDYVRPITAIHYLFAGQQIRGWGGPYQGAVWMDGSLWRPYQPSTFITPPFPEHVSGHSTFSAAAAEVLRSFTGSDHFGYSERFPAGWSRIEPGAVPSHPMELRWPTYSAAADEAGISRLYGGIHFRNGDLEGRKLGREVGRRVWARAVAFFSGTAVP